MIYKSGKLVAIDSVKTNSATISGDGLPFGKPLGVNTSAVIDPLKRDISALSGRLDTVSGNLDTVSGNLNTVSGNLDTVSGTLNDTIDALNQEIETREDEVDYLSATIDTKQDILSAGDNIAIEDNTVSVSGTKEVRLHWPLFARETPDGLHIGIHDTTRHFEKEISAASIADPLSGITYSENGFRISDRKFSADPNIKSFTFCVTYDPGLVYRPDFVPETVMTVTDRDGSAVMVDRRPHAYPQTCTFAACLDNKSPYTLSVSGDTSAFSGLKVKITCVGQYTLDYSYLDQFEDAFSGSGAQILVWNPEVLGVGDGDIVGINKNTALGV